jgi:proline racemase
MCGHSIMSATTVKIEIGVVQPIKPETSVMFDTPAGLIEARARIEGNRVIEVSVANVPSFLYAKALGGRASGKLSPADRARSAGTAYITGIQQFVVDPNDPFKNGFLVGL